MTPNLKYYFKYITEIKSSKNRKVFLKKLIFYLYKKNIKENIKIYKNKIIIFFKDNKYEVQIQPENKLLQIQINKEISYYIDQYDFFTLYTILLN